jgi:hypothetical protein
MKNALPAALAAITLFAGSAAFAQVPAPTTDTSRKADVTYGRVKEFTEGQKIVLDVNNAPDKSFDLTDQNTKVTLAKGLKVGDPVKVTERTVNGKKVVDIVHHSGGNVKHGAKTRTEEKEQNK